MTIERVKVKIKEVLREIATLIRNIKNTNKNEELAIRWRFLRCIFKETR